MGVVAEHHYIYIMMRSKDSVGLRPSGCFTILKRDNYFRFTFTIGVHIDDLNMLNFSSTTLRLGRVYTYGYKSYFVVNTLPEIKIIVEFFSKFKLNTTKHLNFLAPSLINVINMMHQLR